MNAKYLFFTFFLALLLIFFVYHIHVLKQSTLYKKQLLDCQESTKDCNLSTQGGLYIFSKTQSKMFDETTQRKTNGELPCMDVYLDLN